ncbi:MAG: hypothetical protein QM647_12950 [Asticcacaulis sp.]|uniref:hypothetical protein n=1 Tax=Asticcacaulis sp. TaxID=1872648 RepID=UPI0039E63D42
MRASRLILTLPLSLALLSAIPGVSLAMEGEEVVATTAHTVKLPTEAEQEKAKADAAARAEATKPSTDPAVVIAALNAAPAIKRIDPATTYATAEDTQTGPSDQRRQIHGSAGVSIGTGGYRSGYVTSIIPLGETGTLGLAYSQTDYGKNNRYFGYGYDGYGYDGYGYGRYGRYGRGGTSQSFGVSLDLTGNNATDISDDCAPGFRAGAEYIEPLWVTRMRGNRACTDLLP